MALLNNVLKSATSAASNIAKALSTQPKATPTTNASAMSTTKAVPTTSYKDSTGKTQTGYTINDKTYKDAAGTQRIDNGSTVTNASGTYKMINGVGQKVYTGDPSLINQAIQQTTKPKVVQPQTNSIDILANKINQAIKQAPTTYDPMRTQAYTDAKINLRGDNEIMAANGLSRSGENETSRVTREVSLGNSLNSIDKQQQDYVNNLGNQLLEAQYQQAQSQEKQAREDAIATTGAYSNDYQAKINEIKNDNDPTNDFLISYLEAERQQKIKDQQKTDISNVGQYYDNYQAEIDKRTAANPNDPLIAALKQARVDKIQQQKEDTAAQSKFNNDVITQETKDAINIWNAMGKANDYVSSVLGVPVGTKTQDYLKMEYDTSKPYYKPSTSSSSSSKLPTGFTTIYNNAKNGYLKTHVEYDKDGKPFYSEGTLQAADTYATQQTNAIFKITSSPSLTPTTTKSTDYTQVTKSLLPFGLGNLFGGTSTVKPTSTKKTSSGSLSDRISNYGG